MSETGPQRLLASLRVREGGVGPGAQNARTAWSSRSGLVVRLEDEDSGHVGWGEASPLPGYSQGTFDDCARALGVWVEELSDDADASLPPDAPPEAQFAVSLARASLDAARAETSLATWLSGHPPTRRACARLLRTSPTDPSTIPAAVSAVREGWSTLKLKVGHSDVPAEEERAALRALRDAVGTTVRLRLDANGAWSVAEAHARLAGYAGLDVEFVEEPVSGVALLALGETAVPWAVDESFALPSVRSALLERRIPASIVVFKPAFLGDLWKTVDLARMCARRGLSVVVTHGFDGPFGLAAAVALAQTVGDRALAHGVAPHAGLDAWPALTLPWSGKPGWIEPADEPGIGLEIPDGFPGESA